MSRSDVTFTLSSLRHKDNRAVVSVTNGQKTFTVVLKEGDEIVSTAKSLVIKTRTASGKLNPPDVWWYET